MSDNKKELTTVTPDEGSVFATDRGYDRALSIAKELASSDLVPTIYRNKPANCLIALDVARQVKSSPLIVMQNLDIILGKPSWRSTYIAGAIRTRYQNIKVILDGEGHDRGCKVVAYDNNGQIIAEGTRVTMQMANDEGWTTKPGSKWKTMPDLMLQYRANAFFGRIFCPDILIGLQTEFEARDVESTPLETKVFDPFAVAEDGEIVEPEVPIKIDPPPPAVETYPIPEEPKPDVSTVRSTCKVCDCVVSEKVKIYSNEKFGTTLCMDHQKDAK